MLYITCCITAIVIHCIEFRNVYSFAKKFKLPAVNRSEFSMLKNVFFSNNFFYLIVKVNRLHHRQVVKNNRERIEYQANKNNKLKQPMIYPNRILVLIYPPLQCPIHR